MLFCALYHKKGKTRNLTTLIIKHYKKGHCLKPGPH